MNKKISLFAAGFLLATMSILFSACDKNNNNDTGGTAHFQVYITDDPGDYQAVLIDVEDVQINVSDDQDNGWTSLAHVNKGTYDLLKLVNDEDTLLAEADIPAGKVHQIRLILGNDNFVKIGGLLIPLTTPSAQQSGLKLNIQQDVTAGLLYQIHLDFDVAKSIVETGSGTYMLKPVIRSTLEAVGGSIRGVVDPFSFPTLVYAIQGTDTVASTYTGLNGGYILKGLNSGAYGLYFNPSDNTYGDSTVAPVLVVQGAVTTVDTLFLHQ